MHKSLLHLSTVLFLGSLASLSTNARAQETPPPAAVPPAEFKDLPTPPPLPTYKPLPLPDTITPPPALPDTPEIAKELDSTPPPPAQEPEPIPEAPEVSQLDQSTSESVTKEMAITSFFSQLNALIKKQHNPNVPELDIAKALTTAIKQNPEILAAVQDLNTSSGRFISIRSQLLPQVSLRTDYGYTTRELANDKALNQSINSESWGVNIEFSQLIFDGGAALSGIRASISDEVEDYYRLRGVIDRVIAAVKSNFYEVVLNRALIIANQQSVDLLTEQLKDQQNRYEAGTVPRFNVLQAEVALANAKPPLIQAENNYRVAMYRLVQLLGMDYPPGFPSEVPFNIVGELDYKPRSIDADQSIRIAVARNPDLKAQRQLIIGDAARVDEEFAGYLPQIRARATQTNQSDVFTSNITNMVNGWFFGISGTWAVWDGLLTYGNVKTAKARLQQAKINYDNGVREVILQVQQAISNLLQARETVDSQEASVVQGIEALRLAKERLDAGAGTQLDVLNQQTSLLQSQTFLLQAYYDYIRGLAEYDRALSFDTRYQDIFDDPLSKPQAKRFNTINKPDRPQPKLPRGFRKDDPIVPILEKAPEPKKKAPKTPSAKTK